MVIANQMGNVVEVEMPWSDWIKVTNLILTNCGFQINPTQKGSDPDFFAWFEVTTTQWKCIQQILDATGVTYSYRDLSESAPVWRHRPIEKNELDD